MNMPTLTDSFGRRFQYLRLSVDDACNFRCLYCLPEGYKPVHEEPNLSLPEIRRLIAGFAGMGFWKVRLTGGEPTTRHDIVEIAAAAAKTPGITRLAISTNGYRLAELASPLKAAGVGAVNVSVDSLHRERFAQITGRDLLPQVLAGLDAGLKAGLETKVNVVLLKDLNDSEFDDFISFTQDRTISVRFIELMRTGDNKELFDRRHLSAAGLLALLTERGWIEQPRADGSGPARLFSRTGHKGSIGLIAPYSSDFCSTCNRLRVTSRGGLRLCLFAESDVLLRSLLQRDDQKAELQALVREHLNRKEVSHYLPEGRVGDAKHFAMMGG